MRIYEWRVSGLRRGSVVDDVAACLNNGLIIGDVISRIVWNLMPGVAPERKPTSCCVPLAGGQAQKRRLPFRSVAARVTSVGRRTDGLHCRQKAEANQRDEKHWSCFL